MPSPLEELIAQLDGAPAGEPSSSSSDLFGRMFAPRPKKKGLLGSVLDNSAVQGAFNVLSTPLRAVTGTAVAGGKLVGANLLDTDYGEEGPSFRNWWDSVYHPDKGIFFGDIITGNPEKGILQGAYGNQGEGVFTDRAASPLEALALGFAGDVALDPLTFLAPASKIAGGGKLAERIAVEGGEQAANLTKRKESVSALAKIFAGDAAPDFVATGEKNIDLALAALQKDTAAAVAAGRRGGASALTAEQAAQFGIEKGMVLDFGRFGRLRVTSGEGALSNLSVLRHRMQMALGDSLLSKGGEARRFGKFGDNAATNAKARSGAPAEMLSATVAKQLRNTARQMENQFGTRAARITNEAIKDASDEQLSQARALINGGLSPEEVTPQVQILAGRLSDAFRKHGEMLVEQGVLPANALMKEGYFPSPIDQTSREALFLSGLHDAADGTQGARTFYENSRTLWDPTTGQGGIGAGENRITFTAKTRAEAEKKAAAIVGDKLDEAARAEGEAGDLVREFLATHPDLVEGLREGTHSLFSEGREALSRQAKGIGRRVAQARAGRELYARGYGIMAPQSTKGFTDFGPTAEEIAALETKGRQAAEQAEDLAAMARERGADAEQLAAEGADDVVPTEMEQQLEASLAPSPAGRPRAEVGGNPPPGPPAEGWQDALRQGGTDLPERTPETVRASAAALDTPDIDFFDRPYTAALDTVMLGLDEQPLTALERETLDEVARLRERSAFYPDAEDMAESQRLNGDFQHMQLADARASEQLQAELQQMVGKYFPADEISPPGALSSSVPHGPPARAKSPAAKVMDRDAGAQAATRLVETSPEEWIMPDAQRQLDDLMAALDDADLSDAERLILHDVAELRGRNSFVPDAAFVTEHQAALGDYMHMGIADARLSESLMEDLYALSDKYLGTTIEADAYARAAQEFGPSPAAAAPQVDARIQEGLDAVKSTMDRIKDLRNRRIAEAKKPQAVLDVSAYENEARGLARELGIDTTNLSVPQVDRALREAVERFEREGDSYAADLAMREHGRLAEEAERRAYGATLDPDDVGEEVAAPRRKFTAEERAQHREARKVLKESGKKKGRLLRQKRELEAEVAALDAMAPIKADTTLNVTEKRLLKMHEERAKLLRGLRQKHTMDLEDAAKLKERVANESLQPPENMGNLEDMAQPQRVSSDAAQGKVAFEDRRVTEKIEQRVRDLDDKIAVLEERLANRATPRNPVLESELAEMRLADVKAQLDQLDADMSRAKANLPRKGSSKWYDAADGTTVRRPIEGSPLDEATKEYAARLDEINAAPLEPHLIGRERFATGQRPWIDPETNEFRDFGQIAPDHKEAMDARRLKARAEKIRAQWEEIGQTQADHEQMREAFANFKLQLDQAMPPSAQRDFTALVDTQLDQVGNMAAQPLHADATVQSVVDDVEAISAAGARSGVAPDFVQAAEKHGADAAASGEVLHAAEEAGNDTVAEVARMRITAANLGLAADEKAQHGAEWFRRFERLSEDRKLRDAVGSQMVRGAVEWGQYRALQPGLLAPRELADMITKTEEMFQPGATPFWKAWEGALHWMRVWQITSPGFHIRNLFGGIFNNGLAGVDVGNYREFASLWKRGAAADLAVAKGGADTLSATERVLWNDITSIHSPGQIGSEAIGSAQGRLATGKGLSMNPFSTRGVLPRASEMAGNNVEFYLRGSLAYDVLKKGGSLDEAAAAVTKYHFDYSALSTQEQMLKARAIPFLTWTRHNLPLQAQQLLEAPRTYSRFNSFRQEMNARSEADPVVPAYFADISAIRLPFESGGGKTYYVPDLPFRDLGLIGQPIDALRNGEGDAGSRFMQAFSEPLAQTTPLISGPIEWALQRQVYKGIPLRDDKAIALSDLHLPDWITAPLLMTPLVKKVNGRNAMTERDMYIVDKMLPIFARYRRLGGSSEKKQQDKLMSRLISFFAGTQIRTNNKEDQKIANYLDSLETKRVKSLGYSLGAERPSRGGSPYPEGS